MLFKTARNSESVSMAFPLKNKRSLRIDGWFGADVLHAFLPVGAQEVETQAVLPLVH